MDPLDNSLHFEGFIQVMTQGSINLWGPIKRNSLKPFSNAEKKVRAKVAGTITRPSVDKSLFAHCLITSRSQCDVDLCGTLGKYKFSVVPRLMFRCDGTTCAR